MIERVLILDEFQTMGHRIIVLARPYPGAPTAYLKGTGEWEAIEENARFPATPDFGIVLPEGALDAIVSKHLGVAAPTPATERHLTDAIMVRDRLLALVEKDS